MEGPIAFVVFVVALILFVLVMRLIGAWMLRINELIKNQYTIISELRKLNKNSNPPL